MQVRPGLDLEGRLLAMMQERRWQPEASPVLVHDLGGGARAGEEAGVEVRELGHERPAGDDPGCAGLDGGAREVEGVHPVDLELGVGDGARPREATRPRGRQALAPERRARCRAR